MLSSYPLHFMPYIMLQLQSLDVVSDLVIYQKLQKVPILICSLLPSPSLGLLYSFSRNLTAAVSVVHDKC